MQPETLLRDYAEAVRGLGRIDASGVTGDGIPWARVVIGGSARQSGWNAARLLGRLAEQDARRPEVRAMAMQARAECATERELAERLHAFTQRAVRFAREPGEVFQSAPLSLAWGGGDCDDSARALYALARAGGLPVRFAFLEQQGQPAHVFCQIALAGCWEHAETTIPAHFGEHPLDAARRLGIRTRPDLSGRVVTMAGVGGSVIVSSSAFRVRPGARLRFVLQVSAFASARDVIDGLTDIGFASVRATFDRASLDPSRWPAEWVDSVLVSNDPSARLGVLCYAEATYQGDAPMSLNRDLDFATVRDARVVDTATETDDAPPDTSDAAIEVPAAALPPGFGVGATGMPIGSSDGSAGQGGGGEPPAPPMPPRPMPPLLPDPTDTTSPRAAWAAGALAHAWAAHFPGEVYDDRIEQGILAVGALETGLGRSVWSSPIDSEGYSLRWNFGNVHAYGKNVIPGLPPPHAAAHGDTTFAGGAYVTWFQMYAGAVDGMRGLAMTLAGPGRTSTIAALRTGSAAALANAMREHGYYGFKPPPGMSDADAAKKGYATDAQRDLYARSLAAQAKILAQHLGRPLALGLDGPPPAQGGGAGVIAIGVGLLAAGTALAHYFARGG